MHVIWDEWIYMKVELSREIYIDKCGVIKINKDMLRPISGYTLSVAEDIHYSELCVDLGVFPVVQFWLVLIRRLILCDFVKRKNFG